MRNEELVLTETPVMIRTSERRSFANCRQQWWWSYVECWEASDTRPALRFGDLVHRGLAGWYIPGRKRGIKPWLTFEKVYKEQIESGAPEFDVFGEDEKFDALELGTAMLKNYVDFYGNDDHIRVIAPEMSFKVPVYDKRGKLWFYYVGSLDLSYEDMIAKLFGVIETKTAASISTRHLHLDEQAGSYWTFAPLRLQQLGILKPGQDIDLILYNFLRKAFKDDRPTDAQGRPLNKPKKPELLLAVAEHCVEPAPRGATVETLSAMLSAIGIDPASYGEPSKSIPPPLFYREKVYRNEVDRANLMERIKAQAWEMELVRKGKLRVWKNPGATYPNQQCSGCEFNEICEMHETGGQWQELARNTMTTWDPYLEHRGEEGDG
jgi:hypothetical protein